MTRNKQLYSTSALAQPRNPRVYPLNYSHEFKAWVTMRMTWESMSSNLETSIRIPSYENGISILSRKDHSVHSFILLHRTLQWVRSASPIIIHINLDRVLQFLVEDTHYRNRFETGTSGGSIDMEARKSWEVRSVTIVITNCEDNHTE